MLNVQIFRGPDAMSKLWSDVYTSLKSGEERLISNPDSFLYPNENFDKFIPHMNRFLKKNLRGRILVRKAEPDFVDESSSRGILRIARAMNR